MGQIWIASWNHCDLAGKLILVVIGIFSVISWIIMIEKYLLFRDVKRRHSRFMKTLDEGNISRPTPSPLANVLTYGRKLLRTRALPEDKLAQCLERAASGELEKLANNVSFLAVITTVAPFLGLLGTVWGLLLSFNGMAASGSSSIRVVASGVAEALITTVAGLLVAIPSAVGYSYFTEKLRKTAGLMEEIIPQITSLLLEKEPKT